MALIPAAEGYVGLCHIAEHWDDNKYVFLHGWRTQDVAFKGSSVDAVGLTGALVSVDTSVQIEELRRAILFCSASYTRLQSTHLIWLARFSQRPQPHCFFHLA